MPFCPRCGKKLPSDARFCLECGAPVAATAPSPPTSPARRESKTARNIVIAVVLITLLLAAGGIWYSVYRLSTSEHPVVEETFVIGYGGYYHISRVFQGGEAIHVTVRVEEGGPIDVLLMDSGDFVNFERFVQGEIETFSYYRSGSVLDVKHVAFTFTTPTDDRYFIVLNNAGGIEGGAVPVGAVTVYVKATFCLWGFVCSDQ